MKKAPPIDANPYSQTSTFHSYPSATLSARCGCKKAEIDITYSALLSPYRDSFYGFHALVLKYLVPLL